MQILYKYCANIVQILCKYCANIAQILYKYHTNILESNGAIQEHKRLNRAKCHLLTHLLCENTIHWAAYAAKNLTQCSTFDCLHHVLSHLLSQTTAVFYTQGTCYQLCHSNKALFYINSTLDLKYELDLEFCSCPLRV